MKKSDIKKVSADSVMNTKIQNKVVKQRKKKKPKRVVEFFRHNIDSDCLTEFTSTVKNIYITTGTKTAQFEEAFARYLGSPHAVGLMSCTHALHLAYKALGIGEGDDVIVPAFTFVASITATIHAGATPVFVDVDQKTGIMDVGAAEAAITKRTKAICPVHLYGVMAPMDKFSKISKRYNLKLVEDAAHCIEGRGPAYGPGTLSDAAAFSFYATKNITCGEGGALVTPHGYVADKVRILRNHGLSKSAFERYDSTLPVYDVEEVGYKSNMTDLQAALLLPQLSKIENNRKRREKICKTYNEGFGNIPGITLPFAPRGTKNAYHIYTIRVSPHEKRDEFVSAMIKSGVNCAINYRPISHLTLFKKRYGLRPEDHPVATSIGNSILTLPLYPALTDAEVEYVIQTLEEVVEKIL
ncbi:MAG: spore coat protein [bacterium]|nr:MAG: spore coat protein [bacterium]